MTTPEERGWLEPEDDFDCMEQEKELNELGGFHEEEDPAELLEIFDELDTMDEDTFYDLARKLEEKEK